MNKRSVGNTKDQILSSARSVFVANGYAGASMRMIAAEAGISVGCLYIHFKNKEDLYLTIMQQWMKELNEMTSKGLSKNLGPADALRKFVAITIEFAMDHREMIMLQGRDIGFSFASDVKSQFYRDRRSYLAKIIDEGVRKGTFRECDRSAVVKVIFNTLRGFVFSIVVDEEALCSADQCCDLLLNGLLRRNSG